MIGDNGWEDFREEEVNVRLEGPGGSESGPGKVQGQEPWNNGCADGAEQGGLPWP